MKNDITLMNQHLDCFSSLKELTPDENIDEFTKNKSDIVFTENRLTCQSTATILNEEKSQKQIASFNSHKKRPSKTQYLEKEKNRCRKPRAMGYHRWGRSEDIKMLKSLRTHCQIHGIDVDEYFGRSDLYSGMQTILKQISNECHWEYTLERLANRIKEQSANQKLSVRQQKYLKKELNKRSYPWTQADFDEVISNLPFIKMSTLKESLKTLIESLSTCVPKLLSKLNSILA